MLSTTTDAMLATLQSNRALIPPLNTQYEGHNRDEDAFVARTVCFAFPLDGSEKTWAQLMARAGPSSDMWAMQGMQLAMEDLPNGLGGSVIDVDKRSSQTLYHEVVRLQARSQVTGLKREVDRAKLRAHVSCTSKVDLEFAHDVKAAVARLEHEEIQAITKGCGRGGRGRGRGHPDEADEDGAGAAAANEHVDPTKREDHYGDMLRQLDHEATPCPPNPPASKFGDFMAQFKFNATTPSARSAMPRLCHWDSDGVISTRPFVVGAARMGMEHFNAQQLLTDPRGVDALDNSNYAPVLRAHCPHLDPETLHRTAELAMADWRKREERRSHLRQTIMDKIDRDQPPGMEPYRGPPGRHEKMIMSVTAVPHRDDAARTVGLLVRFIVFDPQLNPGDAFKRIIDNADARRQGRQAPQSSRDWTRPKERFPQYQAMFAQSLHPVATTTCEANYVEHVLHADPNLLRGFKNMSDMRTRIDYVNESAPTHVCQVYTIERALSILDKVGARVGDLANWRPAIDKVTYPAWCQTWKYRPEAVFWSNPEYVGLCEQYLPHIDTSQDFLRRLLRGDTAQQLVNATAAAVAKQRAAGAAARRQVQVQQDDENGDAATPAASAAGAAGAPAPILSDTELYIRSNPRVRRDRVAGSGLVAYDTNNPLIHAAAESANIYARVKRFYPAHAYETHAAVKKRIATIAACVGMTEELARNEQYWARPGRAVDNVWVQCSVNALGSDEERRDWERFATRVAECASYNTIVNEVQRVLQCTYEGLIPLTGDIGGTSLSDPLKVILQWFEKMQLPHVTRPFVWKDPQLDAFGNTQVEHTEILTRFARILQPIVCLMCEGLFSAYDHMIEELCFHFILHGTHDTGKSFTGIATLVQFICIKDTVSEVTQSSKRAGTTRKHTYDEINALDECPKWMTDEKVAEKFPEEVDETKLKLTRGHVARKRMQFHEMTPGGAKVPWAETTHTDFKSACLYITNDAKRSRFALSSRMYRMTMKSSTVPVHSMQNVDVPQTLKDDGKMWLNLNQFLSALSKKAAAVGSILPDIEWGVFYKISMRVLDYLGANFKLNTDKGGRPLEIMRSYVRQIVYKMAIRFAFDMPFSPNYEQKFRLSMIQDIQPYLYTTVHQSVWTWTACAGEYVDDDNSNVLRAMCKALGVVDLVEGFTPYEQFAYDVDGMLPFRKAPNPNYTPPPGETAPTQRRGNGGRAAMATSAGVEQERERDPSAPTLPVDLQRQMLLDAWLIDCQYFVFEGTIESISAMVAAHTDPVLSASEVRNRLEAMKDDLIVPEGGRIAPQPMGSFISFHRYKKLPGPGATPEEPLDPGTKRLSTYTHPCPPQYTRTRDNADVEYRTERDIESSNAMRVAVVDTCDLRAHGKLYFMPCAAAVYRNSIILKAIMHAITCSSMTPGKYLLGLPDPHDTRCLQVRTFTRAGIDRAVHTYDERAGFMRVNGELQYQGPEPLSRAPVPRAHGLAFNNPAAVSSNVAKHYMEHPLAPRPVGSETWRAEYKAAFEMMGAQRHIVEDLDEWSATQQHIRCGRPLDEPVRTPRRIREMYNAKRDAMGLPRTTNYNYPYDAYHEHDRSEAARTTSSHVDIEATDAAYAVVEEEHNEQMRRSRPILYARASASAGAAREGGAGGLAGMGDGSQGGGTGGGGGGGGGGGSHAPAHAGARRLPPSRQGQQRAARAQACGTQVRPAPLMSEQRRRQQKAPRDDASSSSTLRNDTALKKLRLAQSGLGVSTQNENNTAT